MEPMNKNSQSVVICDIANRKSTKNYQKYFDEAKIKIDNKDNVRVRHTLNRAKLILISAYIIIGLLVALCIANFMIMKNLNSSIEVSQTEIQNQMQVVNQYQNSIQSLINTEIVSDKLIDSGYVSGVNSGILDYSLIASGEFIEIQSQSNWFNELSNFISMIFGG